MAKLYNLAKMSTATTGTGAITLLSAVTGFLSFAASGVADGETISYAIEDGNNREVGRGVYTASGTTLTRDVLKSTNSDAAINLSGNAQVFITALAEDFGLSLPGGMTNDPRHIPWLDGSNETSIYDNTSANQSSALAFWTELERVGAYVTDAVDDTYKQVCSLTGGGVLFHVIPPAHTNTNDVVSIKLTIDGAVHELAKSQTWYASGGDQKRIVFGAGDANSGGSLYTTASARFHDFGGRSDSDSVFIKHVAAAMLIPPSKIISLGMPCVRFDESLIVETKVTNVYTAGTYGAHCGATYILD